LQFCEEVGDPATGEPIGTSRENLKSAIVGETHEYSDMYPGMARTAREEGFEEVQKKLFLFSPHSFSVFQIAFWFETLAKAEKSHAGRFAKALADLKD